MARGGMASCYSDGGEIGGKKEFEEFMGFDMEPVDWKSGETLSQDEENPDTRKKKILSVIMEKLRLQGIV